MKPSGSPSGRIGGTKPKYEVEVVEGSAPEAYVIVNGLGLVIAGPFPTREAAEEALERTMEQLRPSSGGPA